MYFNIISAVVGALAGLSAFVVFFFHFENRQAGMWAFVSGQSVIIVPYNNYNEYDTQLYINMKRQKKHEIILIIFVYCCI